MTSSTDKRKCSIIFLYWRNTVLRNGQSQQSCRCCSRVHDQHPQEHPRPVCFHFLPLFLPPFVIEFLMNHFLMCPSFLSSSFKKRAPRAMKVIREFAKKTMGTSEVILDASVNQHVWAKGIKGVPRRIRVKLERYGFYLKDCSSFFPSFSKFLQQAQRGRGSQGEDVHFGHLGSGRELQGSPD